MQYNPSKVLETETEYIKQKKLCGLELRGVPLSYNGKGFLALSRFRFAHKA
jgi:hypothetical protein